MSYLVHIQKLYDTEYKLLMKGQVAQSALSCSCYLDGIIAYFSQHDFHLKVLALKKKMPFLSRHAHHQGGNVRYV